MKLKVNGETFEETACSEMNVVDLLRHLGESRPVVVELNGEAIFQRDHPDTWLKEGDRVEIVLIAAGG